MSSKDRRASCRLTGLGSIPAFSRASPPATWLGVCGPCMHTRRATMLLRVGDGAPFARAGPLAEGAERPEGGPDLAHERLRLLEGSEVTALVELVPVPDVREVSFGPPPRRAEDLLREDRAPD